MADNANLRELGEERERRRRQAEEEKKQEEAKGNGGDMDDENRPFLGNLFRDNEQN